MKTFRVSFPVIEWESYDIEAESVEEALKTATKNREDGIDYDYWDRDSDVEGTGLIPEIDGVPINNCKNNIRYKVEQDGDVYSVFESIESSKWEWVADFENLEHAETWALEMEKYGAVGALRDEVVENA
jgi:hypothetical protein